MADPAHAVRVAQLPSGEPLAFSPNGSLLVTRDRGTTMLWSVADRGHPVRLADLADPAARTEARGDGDVAFSPDGQVLFAGGDDAVTVWDVHRPRNPAKLATADEAGDFQLSPAGGLLAFGTADGPVTVWRVADPARPAPLGTLPGTAGQKFAFASDQVIAATDNDGGVRLWRVPDLSLAGAIPAGPSHPPIGASDLLTTIAFSAGGRTLSIVTGNATATRWDVADPDRPVHLGTVSRDSYGPGVVRFSPDATVVAGAAAVDRHSITLWRVA